MAPIRCVCRRELSRIASRPYYLFLLLVLPLASFGVLIAIFGEGVPRDLPVAVVDDDHTSLSRQLTRMIDASPSMRVAWQVADAGAARALILENKAYAMVAIPRNMERDVRRGDAPRVVAYYNAQLLLPSSLIRRDLRAAVGTLSAGLELRVREAGPLGGGGQRSGARRVDERADDDRDQVAPGLGREGGQGERRQQPQEQHHARADDGEGGGSGTDEIGGMTMIDPGGTGGEDLLVVSEDPVQSQPRRNGDGRRRRPRRDTEAGKDSAPSEVDPSTRAQQES